MKRKIVGIITIPFDLSHSYISYGHIKWLKSYSLEVHPIPYNTTEYSYHFNKIHGLYIPSGIISKSESTHKNNPVLIKTCREFMKLAIESNNNNAPFPIWGTCYGMQLLIKSISNVTLTQLDTYPNIMMPFIPTKEGVLYSNIIKNLSEDTINNWMNNPVETHNHGRGVSLSSFKHSKILSELFYVVSIGINKDGIKFVSLIEGKKYPFYGVQWHPEMSKVTQVIIKPFIDMINKSKKHITVDDKFLSQKNKPCKIFSDGLYDKCMIYEHPTHLITPIK
jgi:gamma-glutamyl hydrolase